MSSIKEDLKKKREEILLTLASSPDNEQAWYDLYLEFWPFVYARLYHRLGGNAVRAQECAQTVFVRLAKYQPFHKFKTLDDFQNYLRKVSKHVVWDEVRKDKPLLFVENYDELGVDAANILDSSVEAAEARDLISNVSDQLLDSERSLLNLLLEGASVAEIGEKLGISYSNAGVRIHRLRDKLRGIFSKR